MKKLLILFASMLILSGCGTVPLTGRRQILLVSDQEVLSSSLTQYKEAGGEEDCRGHRAILAAERSCQ